MRLAKRLVPRPVRRRIARYKKQRRRHDHQEACPLPGGTVTRLDDGQLPHYCLPLENPSWVDPSDATYLVDDDAIIGFAVDGQPHAVPWDVMAAHHVANLELGGRRWTLTLCDMCVGGGLYEATKDGTTFRFRVDGLYAGTPYVIDQPTGSLWTMVTMRPIQGPALAGGPLLRHPVIHATWSEWVGLHPHTKVVHDPGEPEDGHGGDARTPGHEHYPAFAESRLVPKDPRLPPLDLVLGVEVGGEQRAYPLELLHREGGIVNDVVGGHPIVAIAVPGTYVTVAFDREVDGRVLTMQWKDGATAAGGLEAGDPLLVDDDTRSSWDLFGRAVDGPLEGRHLSYVWGGIQKWFNWSNLAYGSTLWAPASTKRS